MVTFTQQFDVAGHRTQLAATIGEDDDFLTGYTYDNLGRMTRIPQTDQGDNAVAEKRVDFTYDAASQWDTITRYMDLDGGSGNEVMTGTYSYDLAGRLTGLVYTHPGEPPTTLRSFGWTYDPAGRITGHDSDIAAEDVADNDYAYDDTNQLTGADYTDAGRTDESYVYDANGNRTMTGYDTGDNNQLLEDGTCRYAYDEEGNREFRFVDEDSSDTLNTGDTDITEYTWDHRNRLVEVAHRAAFGQAIDC